MSTAPGDGVVAFALIAGALATGGDGTAFAVLLHAHRQGKNIHVYADETRPLLQGARLTAWELQQQGIPFQVIVDGASGHFMRRGGVDLCVVGADRVAANIGSGGKGEGSVLGMGVFIGKSTKIYDRETGEVSYGRIPAGSVVVSGNLPASSFSNASISRDDSPAPSAPATTMTNAAREIRTRLL